jgi:hypothetical protein
VSLVVECPKGRCGKRRWHATGRTQVNRHGRQQAQVVCEACGYAWWNSLPEALDACRAVLEAQGSAMPDPTAPLVSDVLPKLADLLSRTTGQHEIDFKQSATGETE